MLSGVHCVPLRLRPFAWFYMRDVLASSPGPQSGSNVTDMRWDQLFADLEQQAAALQAAELESEIADRVRGENAKISIADRLRGHVGRPLHLGLADGSAATGTLRRVAADFVLLASGQTETLVPLHAISWLEGLGAAAATPAGVVESRLGLRSALRALARDRVAVTAVCLGTAPITGTPGRVGADYLELAVHPLDESPRRGTVRSQLCLPLGHLILLRHAVEGA